jgi:iron complex outermembrane receptor protein
MKIHAIALACTLISTATNAAGAEAALEEVLVTGVLADDDTPINPVRLPQSARISSQILTADDVEKLQARDVYDLLNYATGVFTTTSGKKSPSNLNIRGDGNFAFIIDGAYVPPQLSSRILQAIPADAIAETRIVRTSTALTVNPLVGIANPSGAPNNGFIVVRTRDPQTTEAALRLYGGSYGTYGASGRMGTTFEGAAGTGYMQVMGSTYATDGPQGFNLDKDYNFGGMKLGGTLGPVDLDFSFMKSWAGYGIVRGTNVLRPSSAQALWRLDPINSSVITANGSVHWTGHQATLLTLARTESKGRFLTTTVGSSTLTSLLNNNTFFNAALRHNLFLEAGNLQFGADYIHWDNPTGQYYHEGVAREEEVHGLFLQGDRTFLDKRLDVDLGLRVDQVRVIRGIDYFAPGRQPNANVRVIADENLPSSRFLSAGVSYRATTQWLLNARYGLSHQPPRTGVVLANPQLPLKGEKRQKFELGIDGTVAPALQPALNFFYIHTRNEVSPVSYAVVAGEQVGLYGNTNSKRTGAEAVIVGRGKVSGGNAGYRLSVTHYFDVLDPSGLLARTQPDTVAELTGDYAIGPWRLSAAAKYVARYESNAFTACAAPNLNCNGGAQGPYLPVGNFVNVDLAMSRQFDVASFPTRLTASVKNLMDDNYETSIGYPSVGRQLALELLTEF